MFNILDPYPFWQKCDRDPYAGMNDDKRMKVGLIQGAIYLVAVALAIAICGLIGSCTTTQYVPITETHTEHHWHTDSVKQRDSTHTERETIIRELDSAAMTKYGIQMQSNQRAWLVLQREMENRLRELDHMTAQRDTVRDTIPKPYPVEKRVEIEKPLSWWQKTTMYAGDVMLVLLLGLIIYGIVKLQRKLRTP